MIIKVEIEVNNEAVDVPNLKAAHQLIEKFTNEFIERFGIKDEDET